jgi:hypothetical protein
LQAAKAWDLLTFVLAANVQKPRCSNIHFAKRLVWADHVAEPAKGPSLLRDALISLMGSTAT